MSTPRSDGASYFLSVVLALASGWLQIKVHDLLFTALLVVASAMVLGAMRPQSPWRWAILFPFVVPLTQLWPGRSSRKTNACGGLRFVAPASSGHRRRLWGFGVRQTLQRLWAKPGTVCPLF